MRPQVLYIAADGPRHNEPSDIDLCKKSRDIVSLIDWDCQVKTLFQSENQGCKYAVSSAITWFFEHEDEGIILEDDCLPNASFFSFCRQLLEKYRFDEKIMHITGSNLNDRLKFGDGSYYYSHYAHIWGWATWKRAWEKYDLELDDTDFYQRLIKTVFEYPSEREFWNSRLKLVKEFNLDTWDYQWMFSIWKEKGICLNCNFNLVENIGFGDNSTHTKGDSSYICPERKELFEIIHPSHYQIIEKAEAEFIKIVHGSPRKGTIRHLLEKHFLQRLFNLHYKIKLKITAGN